MYKNGCLKSTRCLCWFLGGVVGRLEAWQDLTLGSLCPGRTSPWSDQRLALKFWGPGRLELPKGLLCCLHALNPEETYFGVIVLEPSLHCSLLRE